MRDIFFVDFLALTMFNYGLDGYSYVRSFSSVLIYLFPTRLYE